MSLRIENNRTGVTFNFKNLTIAQYNEYLNYYTSMNVFGQWIIYCN